MKLKSYLLSGIVIVLISILLFPNVSASYPEYLLNHSNNNDVSYDGSYIFSTPIWSYNVSYPTNIFTPIIDSFGYIYARDTENCGAFCLYPNGTLKWKYDPPLTTSWLGTAVNLMIDESYDAVIISYYDTNFQGYVKCINIHTGVLTWTVSLSTNYMRTGEFAHEAGNGYFYFVNMESVYGATYCQLVKMSLNDGSYLYQQIVDGPLTYGKPVLQNNSVYVYGYNGNTQLDTIYRIFESDLTINWTKTLSGTNQHMNGMIGFYGTNTDSLFFTTQEGTGVVYCIYGNNGTTNWTHTNIGYGAVGYPILGGGGPYNTGRLFIASSSGGVVYTFDFTNGNSIDTQTIIGASQFTSSGTRTVDGWLYIPDIDGSIWKISTYNLAIYSEWKMSSGFPDIQGVIAFSGDEIAYGCSGNFILAFRQLTPSGIILSISSIGSPSNIYIGLNWTLPISNGTDPLLGFKLFRSLNNITFYNIMSFTNTTLTYTDSSIAGDMDYYYYVLGYNINGDGDPSNTVTAKVTTTIIESETGIVGTILPFMMAMFMALFVSIIYDKRFSLSMFLICFGMMISVLVWLEAIPTYGMVITIILYVSVIWMAYSQTGGVGNE